MGKLWIPVIFLMAAGIGFSIVAMVCYHSLSDLYQTLSYYGVTEKMASENDEIMDLLFRLKVEKIAYSILATLAWIAAVMLGVIFRNTKSRAQ